MDPEQVRRWLGAGERERALLELAGQVPELLAEAATESLQLATGIDKRKLARILVAAWYLSATRVLDYMRAQCPAVPGVVPIPERIEALRKIERND